MSTKPLEINKNSRRYKLYTIWSRGSAPEKAWHYRYGVAVMISTYICTVLIIFSWVLALIMILSILVSPIYDHFWPGSWYFGGFHEQSWPKFKSFLPFSATLFVVTFVAYCFWGQLRRLGRWLWSHRPSGRPVKIVE